MKDAAAKSERLVSGSVRKQVLSFALTALAGLVFNSVYSLTDALFVGRGVGDAAMGGVSAVYPFVILQSAIATTIGGGAASIVSRALGSGDKKRAATVTLSAMAAFYVTAVLITAIGFAAMPRLLSAMGATGELYDHAKTYFIIILAGNVFSTGFSSIIRAEGGSLYSLLIWVIPISVNVALDAGLILGAGLGVAGSAASTVAAQFISFSMSVLWFARFSSMPLRSARPSLSAVRSVIGIGVPSLVQIGSLSLISLIINNRLSVYDGESAVTAYGYMSRLVTFAVAPFTALAQALSPVAGFNYGAGKGDRLRTSVRFTAMLAAGCAAALMLVAGGGADALMRIFTADGGILRYGGKGLRLLALSLPFLPVGMLAGALMQSVGAKLPSLLCYAAQPLLFLPLAFLLPLAAGGEGLWWAFVLSSALSAGVSLAVLYLRRSALLAAPPYTRERAPDKTPRQTADTCL